MLKKFTSIKSVGSFHDFRPKGDVTFRHFTAIWGPNGVGKSTLCDVMRSFSTGEAAPLLGRRSVGAQEGPEIDLLFDAGIRSFRGQSWTAAADCRFHIFDNCFIHDNVYVGEFVELDQKKRLYRVIVGEEGVKLAASIDSLDEELRETTKGISSQREALAAKIPRSVPLETFLSLQRDSAIEPKIEAKTKEVAALKDAALVAGRPLLAEIAIPALPDQLDVVLASTIEHLGAGAATLVQDHVKRAHAREAWLSEGLPFVQKDRCPFCGQAVVGSELVAAFRGYFSEAYGALKQKVAALQQWLTSSLSPTAVERILVQVRRNRELGVEWAPLVGSAWDRDIAMASVEPLRTLMEAALARKTAAPLDSVAPIFPTAEAKAFVVLGDAATAYNAGVKSYNADLTVVKERARSGNLATAREDLAVLECRKKRFDSTVAAACEELKALSDSKNRLEREKTEAKNRLDIFAASILARYQTSINGLLLKFGADFRIQKLERRYPGGTPSASYFVEIENVLIELGDRKTSRSEPSFRNTLSSGDRSALALAFFLAQIAQDLHIADTIVVFDDPFTSQDRSRRLCTQQVIRQVAKVALQVIVLSHDEVFLADCCAEGFALAAVKTLQLRRGINGPMLEEWDVSQPRSQVLVDLQILKNFLVEGGVGGTAGLRDMAGKIRPLLETWLRGRFPGRFQEKEWLGDMISVLRTNEASIPEGSALPQELDEINEYSKRYHHGSNPGADAEPVDEIELKTYVRRTTGLVGGSW